VESGISLAEIMDILEKEEEGHIQKSRLIDIILQAPVGAYHKVT
jgi:hypothetical protein